MAFHVFRVNLEGLYDWPLKFLLLHEGVVDVFGCCGGSEDGRVVNRSGAERLRFRPGADRDISGLSAAGSNLRSWRLRGCPGDDGW